MANPHATAEHLPKGRAGNRSWIKGVSGNPSGLPRWKQELRTRFAEDSVEFYEQLRSLALGHRLPLLDADGNQVLDEDGEARWIVPDAKTIRAALADLFDRGLGRPPQAVRIISEAEEPTRDTSGVFDLERVNPEDRRELIRIAQRYALANVPP
jgi:hypothetical protein